jgi:Cdc6-like AAA superfamily ATPase
MSWPFNKSDTENLLSQIERMKSTFDLALSAENMSALANLTEDVREMKNELRHRRELDVKIQLDEKRRKVIDFFGRVNPHENYQMGLKLRQSGTGLWLTKGDSFQGWLRSPDGSLWLHGIPGAGKTVLASAVIQDTIEALKSGESVAYFYCDYKDESRQDPLSIFGSIAAQLALQDEEAFDLLKEYYDLIHQEGSLARSASPEQIVDLIRKQTLLYDTSSLILDGLDECGDNLEEVLDLWISIKKEASGAIRTIVLSRELEVIEKRLIEDDYSRVSIAAQSADIRLYVAAEIKQRRNKGRWDIDDPVVNDFIQQKLVEKAQGM